MKTLLVALFIVVAVLSMFLLVAMFLLRRFANESATTTKNPPGKRLYALARERDDYKVFIGVPPANPSRWGKVSQVTEQSVTVEGYGEILLTDVTTFLVAYPNGQLLDYHSRKLPLPRGITALESSPVPETDVIQLEDLEEGKRFIRITYGPSTSRPSDPNYYSTTLTNISDQKIRVLRFGGYRKTGRGFKLATVTRRFFSAEDFQVWYGLGDSEWIHPGESVSDKNNYGSPPSLWAYYCETEDGKQFIVGALIE